MAQPLKVINVIRTVRQGVSKKTNKPYELILVQTEDGNEVEVFGPVKDGDMIGDITFNAQYDQLQGKVIKADRNGDLLNELSSIKTQLNSIEKKLDNLITKPTPQRGAISSIPTVSTIGPNIATGPTRRLPNSPPSAPVYNFTKPKPADAHQEPPHSDEDMPVDLMEEEGYDNDQI